MTPAEAVAISAVFGEREPLARALHDLLATTGIERGLVGPHEAPRLWARHLLNCAVLADLLPSGARVVDVGSGAGLPGLVLACRRADLRLDLVEPMQRRVSFLSEAIAMLGLSDAVRVVRGRAEDPAVVTEVGGASWCTARAVAPLDRLAAWSLPLLRPDGTLLAMKGARAAEEIVEHQAAVRRAGGGVAELIWCGRTVLPERVAVIAIRRRGGP